MKLEPLSDRPSDLADLADLADLEALRRRTQAQHHELTTLRRLARALEAQADQLLGLGRPGRPRKREYPFHSAARLAERRRLERSLEPLLDRLAVGVPAAPRRPGRRVARLPG